MRYQDKVTIVTGGTSGIGAGVCELFVQNGSKVVIAGIQDEAGKKLEEKLTAVGPGEALYIHCDVREEEQVKNLVDKTVERFGRIDCLVNNAGRHPPLRSIDDMEVADFKALLDLNVVGYFLTAKYTLPHLRKNKGNIINNASLVAHKGQKGAVDYVTTKGAVISMTRALALDEAGYNVRVNSISVGSVLTPAWEDALKNVDDPESIIKNAEKSILLKRFGTLDEVAKLCLYLAADGTFCTGIDVKISGGVELGDGVE